MAQTRSTIELLTNILEENGASKLTAETFRLGKFNHDDAVKPFWKLLFELVYYCEFGTVDAVSVQAYSQLTAQEIAVYVKRALQSRGFLSTEFAALPNDMTDGSRELLLAFGWLVCKENILTQFMKNCTSPLDDILAKPSIDASVAGPEGDKTSIYAGLQQLLLLNNKLRLSLRSLAAMSTERALLDHYIHESTYRMTGGAGDRKHLTPMEVYMLQKPDLLNTNLNLLDQDNQRLQNLMAWRRYEDHFWRWMGSVLDAKLQSQGAAQAGAEGQDNAGEQVNGLQEALVYSSRTLQETHLSLKESISKYQTILADLVTQWDLKGGDVTEEELDRVLAGLDQELTVQKARISVEDHNAYMKNTLPEPDHNVYMKNMFPEDRETDPGIPTPLPRSTQLYYEPRQNVRLKCDGTTQLRTADPAPSGAGTGDIVDIEEEMLSLSHLVNKMEQDLTTKQNHLKNQLQSLNDKFPNAICIPPMDPKC